MHLSKLYFKRLGGSIVLGLLLVSFFAAAIVINPVVGQGNWWDNSWLYRKTLTIDHTKVAGSLTNFPVLIDLTDTDISAKAQSDGDDIAFTDSSDNKLNHEIELYNSTSGHLVAWARANLSSTADTVLYMYYGNAAASSQQNPEGVWDSDYAMVQHLEETSGTECDSTSNSNDGTAYGGLNQNAAGQVDGADAFDGTNDYIDTMADDALSTAFTLSLWIKTTGLASWNHIISSYVSGSGFMIANNLDKNRPWLYMSAKNVTFSGGIYDNAWHYLVGTFDGSNIRSYTDGSFNQSIATSFSNGPVSLKIGCQGSPNYYYSGSMDEVRFSKVARSSDWIITEYNNQHSPSTFYTVGPEELPPAPIVSIPSPVDAAVGVSIDISELGFNLTDRQGNLMDYWVSTIPNIGSDGGTDVTNGRYSVPVSGLAYNTMYTWHVNVTDGTNWTNETYTFTTELISAWWNNDWPYRKMILIDHTKVFGSLTNFPVLIDIMDTDLMTKAQGDGDDVVFTDSSDNKLNHEIELYNSTSGHLVTWVRANLYSTVDTVLYMYYGNPAATAQQNAAGVWDSNFMMVQHLEETSGTEYDSTLDNNDGTPYGGLNQNVAGKINGADAFDGSDDYIDTGMDDNVLSSAFTLSLWIKTAGLASWNHIVSNYVSSPASGFMIANNQDQNRPWLYMSAKNVLFSAGLYDGSWHYLVGTFDGSNIRSYTDGSFNQSTAAAFSDGSVSLKIGTQGSPAYYYSGSLDEVRVSKVARSADWIETEYNSQHSPSTFYTVGAEKAARAPVVLDLYPADGAINVPLSLSQLSFNLTDAQGDLMDYWVSTIPNVGSGSGTGVANGRYIVPVSGLAYGTTYIWHVNVADGIHWNNKTLAFTSVREEPLVYGEDPIDGAVDVRLNPPLQADIFDAQADSVDWLVRTNASGTWMAINSGTLPAGSGTVSTLPSNMDQYDTTYYWMVCAIDPYGSGRWTNETYMFTTKATWQITHKWTASFGSLREAIGVDVNGDDVREVIQPYAGGVKALSGSSGNVIWTYLDGSIDHESVALACDLTNDGVPEILVAIPGGMLALRANGSLYWKRTDLGGSGHSYGPIAFDLDGDGYPTIFVATKLDGTLYALSHDGQILYSNPDISKPCWGQISLMDFDSDDHFELYLTDWKYVKSFWAENLTLRWSRSIEIGAAHCVEAAAPQLVDVDGDGVRDVVVTICDYYDEANYTCGVAILDASDGSIVRMQTGTGMQGVLTPSIYDVDGDGHLEFMGQCEYDYHHHLMIWDLTNWNMDKLIELSYSSTWQPRVADVTGDGKMEIIAIDGSLLRIFNGTYDEIAQITISGSALVYPLVEDFDGDGLGELLVTSGSGVHVYDTDGAYPLSGFRSEIMYYSEYRLGTAEYIPPPTAIPEIPIVSDPYPVNGAVGVQISLSELSFNLTDFQGDPLDYWVTTSPEIGSGSGTDVFNGRYTILISGLVKGTTYTWRLSVTDGTYWNNKTFTFIAEADEPTIFNENPPNGTVGVRLNPLLQADIFDAQVDSVDWFIRTNTSGTWVTIDSGTLPSGSGTVSVMPSTMNQYNTTYCWMVCATDRYGSGGWTNKTYTFKTKETFQITQKWTAAMPSVARRGACVADINGDGINEVIQSYNGGVAALSGINGGIVWRYTDSLIIDECQSEVADLDKDGIPEVLVGLVGGIVALRGDGSVYWRRTDLGGDAHGYSPLIFDLDGDGYPTVFVATKTGTGAYDGQRVWALSYDGQILYYSEPVVKPCWGAISLMDYDSDGHFEIYITDWGNVKSFWAENLTTRWVQGAGGGVNAHSPQLIDVNGDGIRDIVVYPGQSDGGAATYVAVLSAADGHVIARSPQQVEVCLTPSIYDIDGDGHVEVIGCGSIADSSNRFVVYDLVTWTIEIDVPLTWGSRQQPRVAEVTGDGIMDILVPDGKYLRIFDNNYNEIATLELSGAYGDNNNPFYPMVADVDSDGLTEIVVGSSPYVQVFDTDARASVPPVRAGVKFYSEYRLGVAEYVPLPGTWTPRLEMNPNTVTCRKRDEHFTMQIEITRAANAKDFAFEIRYNTTLLDYVDLSWGTFLNGAKHIDLVDEGAGTIQGHIDPGTPVSGGGLLLKITFNANKTIIWKDCPDWLNKLEGQIWFHWAKLSTSGPDFWYEEWTGGRREIEVTQVDYKYIPIQGDVDSDGDVDILDLRSAAAYYNTKEGDPNWTMASTYDINGDNVIDIYDLILIAVKLGYTYP